MEKRIAQARVTYLVTQGSESRQNRQNANYINDPKQLLGLLNLTMIELREVNPSPHTCSLIQSTIDLYQVERRKKNARKTKNDCQIDRS